MSRNLELVFTPTGTAELCRGDHVLWASDDDDEFRDEHTEEFLNADRDAQSILDYLVGADIIKEQQAEELEIVEEAYEGDDLPESDESFEDEEIDET